MACVPPCSTPAAPLIVNATSLTSSPDSPAASRASTSSTALPLGGPVTVHAQLPVFATADAMRSNGPAAPLRESSRSTPLTPRLSRAFHSSMVLEPETRFWPPFGASTVTSGRAVSA